MDHSRVSSPTKLVQVVLSSVRKQSSLWEKRLSFLWVIGAFLVVIVYIGIPILVVLQHIPNILFQLLFAACILFIVEVIISVILWKTSSAPTPSITAQTGQYDEGSVKSC